AQLAGDAPRLGYFLVDPPGDADRALTVEAADDRRAVADLDVGHGPEGHFRAVGRANAHGFQVTLRGALLARVAHHHADVVLAALNALDFLAEEGLTNLARQILLAQAQHLGLGPDVELQLLESAFEGVAHVVGALVGLDPLFE